MPRAKDQAVPGFITFEGPEGAGKTTQIAILAERLAKSGTSVVTTRQPGGDQLGVRLRTILLEQSEIAVEPMAELLMMMADRAQSVALIIRPALDSGAVVLCDRYADSSIAYQGYGRGIEIDTVRELNRIATGGLTPGLTILLDLDPEVGLGRQKERNRMESLGSDFHTRVRAGFLQLSIEEPGRFAIVDASMTVDSVAEAVWRAYEAHYCDRA